MEPGPITHDLWGEEVTLDDLDNRENHQDGEHADQPATRLEEGEGQDGCQPDDVSQIGNDVEKAEDEPDDEAVLQTDDRESDAEQKPLEKGDDELAPEEGDNDVEELSEQVDDVPSGLGLEEWKVFLEVFDMGRVCHQKERKVDREDRPTDQDSDPGHDPRTRSQCPPAEELEALDDHAGLAFDCIADRLSEGVVGQKAGDQGCMLRCPFDRVMPPQRATLNEPFQLLGDDGPEEPSEGDQRHDRGQKDSNQRRDPAQVEAAVNEIVVGLDDQRRHSGHRERQKDVRESGEEGTNEPEDRSHRDHDHGGGKDGDGCGDGCTLTIAELYGHVDTPSGG